MQQTVACAICGGSTKVYQPGTVTGPTYFKSADYNIAGGDYRSQLPIVKCTQCGHGTTVHGVTPAEILEWYKRHELDRVFLADEEGRRRTDRKMLSRIEKLSGKKGRILDIGAGPGLFLSEAQRRGWQTDGLEPTTASRAYAAEHFQVAIRAGGAETLSDLPEAAYDAVTMFDVIEHLPDPVADLREVRRVLKPYGVLVIVAPKFDSLMARLLGRRWYSIFPAHLHYFTTSSLTRALQQAGFTPMVMRHQVKYLRLGYILERIWGWISGTKSQNNQNSKSLLSIVVPLSNGDEFEVYARARQ